MMLYVIHKLMGEGRVPRLPVFLNSPMAIKATEIFCKHNKEHLGCPSNKLDTHLVVEYE